MIILRGSCYLQVAKEPLLPLVGGDFVLLPSLQPYSLRSEPKRPLRPIERFVTEEEFRRTRVFNFEGGENPPVSVIVGCFTFEMPESKLLIKHLAPVISLRASDQSASPWFQSTLHFIAAETSADLPGAPAIVDRLAEVLFIQAMRACIQATYPPGNPNWLRALSDKQIGEALKLMHAEPSRTWTVVELARSVAMSRSAFAERFKELVGETPLDHLTQWRMVRAAGIMLSAKTKRFAEIASAVGYDSESSFGKAFRRVMGVSAGQYRREKRLEPSSTS
jgi:AraC-like DNA-binding protein